VLSPSAIMLSISSNSYINKKRQSNARKAAAAAARHRQPALQVHRNPSAQSSSSARFSSSRMMLQERDFNTNVTSKRRRRRSSRESTQSMSSAKQRKIAQQMKLARQNHEDRSDIHKLQNRWKKIRQRHQRYCERATRLNRSSSSSLLITSKKLRSALIQSLISHRYDLCIDCDVSRALNDFSFRDLINSLILCVYCIDESNLSENEMHWCSNNNHNVLCSIFQRVNELESSHCVICKLVSSDSTSFTHVTLNQNFDASIMFENDWNLIQEFYSALENFEQNTCNICNKIDFDMKLIDWEKRRSCHWCTKNRSINFNDFTLWFIENNMNSLCLFINLSELSLVKKMLIVRAYIIMKFHHVKRHQYKYIDHVINFVQNTFKIISQLLSLSSELQVLFLKLIILITENSNANHQFEHIFHVHHCNVEVWLIFLRKHHLNYINIVIDVEWLSQLS